MTSLGNRSLAFALCVVLSACLMTPVMKFGEGKTAKQAQHDTMASFGPARLATDKKWDGEVTTKKIRVWADNEYRTQNREWKKSFEEPLGLANLVLEPTLGLRLVAEFAVWDRHVPGATLSDHLSALIEHDPGSDAFVVVGLTSSLPLVSSTFEQLGMATLGGRHLMLRGYADLEERKMYANAFPDLTAEERELALVHLRHHKTAVILLHELGHNFGMEHEKTSDTIMHATYSNHSTSFSEQARLVMLRTIDQRLGRKSTPPTGPESAPTPVAAAGSGAGSAAAPPAKPAGPVVHREPIMIHLTKAGHTIVAGKRLSNEALDTLMKGAAADDPDTKLIIQQDRKVPVGSVGALLDRAKAAGLTKFEFAWAK